MRLKSLKFTEKQFTAQVLQYAKLRNWRTAHFRPGRVKCKECRGKGNIFCGKLIIRCTACKGTGDRWCTAVQGDGKGFFDTVFVRERLVWAEQKMPGEKLTPEQAAWYVALVHAKQEVYVWEPSDWSQIEKVLA